MNSPWKGTILKGNFIFQPLIFRGYSLVSFQGGNGRNFHLHHLAKSPKVLLQQEDSFLAYLGFRITVFVATLLVCETTLILVSLSFHGALGVESVCRWGLVRGVGSTVLGADVGSWPRYGSVVYGSMFLHQKAGKGTHGKPPTKKRGKHSPQF